MRALVAEDEPEMLATVAEVLRQHHFDVVAVSSGAELVEKLADEPAPDLLVTDISMPWMSGVQVALAARSAGLRMPILVMTALRDPRIDAQVAALGPGAALLRKPFDLRQLESAIEARMQWSG